MKITCNRDLLINNINIVSKAVSQKTTQPILECMLLTADKKGFRLMSNNLELSIETSNIEADVYEMGTVALNAKLFANIARSLPGDSVSITVDENNCALIKSGRSEFKLMGEDGTLFPQPLNIEREEPLKIKSSIFKNIIKQTIFSVATEETRPVLMGEFLEVSPKSLNIVAIDGFRVSFRTTPIEEYSTYKDIIVPAKTLMEISNIAPSKEDEYVSIYINDRHALFEMTGCTMVSRLIEGQYMDYKNLFNTDNKTLIRVERKELLSALERSVLIVKDPKTAPVRLNISDGLIEITSKTEIGETFDQVNIDFEGESLAISFNASYLTDVLKNIEDDRVEISFMSSLSPCIIKGIDKDDYMYLVLPLKV